MTCPDWTRLTAHRADPRLPEPAGLLALAPSHPTPRTIVGAERSAGAGAGLATPALAAWAAEPASAAAPVFEGLDRPRDARVYQLDGEGLVVVMIVDETLDV
jgi:hypothetical protein